MKYKAFSIIYDTDGEEIDLPKEIEIEVSDDCDDVEEAISVGISNKTEFCHFGFNYEPIFTSERIKEFLDTFCTKVRKNESCSYAELMMDDHKCIQIGKKQYYVPENNSCYSNIDELIYDYLIEKHIF